MRKLLIIGGSLAALASAFVATAHCCERLNFLAAMGLLQPG